jgi:hypothetical protein
VTLSKWNRANAKKHNQGSRKHVKPEDGSVTLTAISSLYCIPPMPTRQQRRAAERSVRKHPVGCTISLRNTVSAGDTQHIVVGDSNGR